MLFNFDFKNSFHLLYIIIIDVFGLKNTYNFRRNCRSVDWPTILLQYIEVISIRAQTWEECTTNANVLRATESSKVSSSIYYLLWFFFIFVFILASLLHSIHFVPTKWFFSLKMMINLNSTDECLWLLFLLNFF